MAVEPDDAKFISKLDETSKQKAKEELNERNDKDRELAVQTLRQWILEQDWLKTPTDFQFLLRFLRARKYSQLGARETLENYWTVRTKFPDWCKNVDPGEEVLQEIIKSGIIVCPKRYDNEGRRVLIDRTAHIDVDEANQKWGLKNVFRALVLVSDWYCLDENVQVNGMQVLFDASDITLNTATTIFTGENGKNLIKYYQVKLHGNSMVSVYKDIDRSVLPTEYLPDDYTGPSAGPLKGIIDEMLEDMMVPEFRSYIRNLSSEKHRVDFFKRKRDDQPAESFRKLHAE
ncbi:alpha-tocopherol transfer protein-like isoform X2 [Mercenaria mercenaria]|uniref:alpha-tocopherol transfer protein-like isoform X2 n=1 Tax=Mercenaria mercenaria TaxID=6596 RepID=UPI001E1D90C0|nr:alpha-tocopherol transfer protein-like isoform X2 [Mercenaria mercenaria]